MDPTGRYGTSGPVGTGAFARVALIYCAWSVQQAGEIRGEQPGRAVDVHSRGAARRWCIGCWNRLGSCSRGMTRGHWELLAFLFLRHPAQLPVGVLPFYWVDLTHFWPGGAAALLLDRRC